MAPLDGGDFLPIMKYDARTGLILRMDRIENNGNFANEAIDITSSFKGIVDLENIEYGWMLFASGTAPDFKVVPIGKELPARPSDKHKYGVRLMLKLSKDCGGDKPIRELAGTSKAFLSGIDALYDDYLAEKDKNPNKLPVVVREKVTPITTGKGAKASTHLHPTFRIIAWLPRGDLVFVPKATQPAQIAQQPHANGAAPPSTGSTQVEAPKAAETVSSDDFG
jgi:hypothetical protein